MADQNLTLGTLFQADVTQLTAALKKIRTEFDMIAQAAKQLQSSLGIVNNAVQSGSKGMGDYALRTDLTVKAMKGATGESVKFKEALGQLNGMVAKTKTGYDTAHAALMKVEKAVHQTGLRMTESGKNGEAFANTANRMALVSQTLSGSLKVTNGAFVRTDAVQKTATTSLGQWVNSVKAMGMSTTQATQPITFMGKQIGSVNGAIDRLKAAFKVTAAYGIASTAIYAVITAFKAGTQSIVEYDQALKNLQAITGATGTEVAVMGETIRDVARTTKFSTTEVADGMVLLGQSGFSAGEAMNAIQATANLATGTLSDMKLTTDLLTTTIRAFNLDTLESSRVADVMANAINKSKLTIDKLRISFSYIAATASQAGLSLEETAASMMVLANNGLRASTIGTGLRQVLARLLSPNARLREAYEASGVALDQVNPKTVGYQKALENLSKVLYNSETRTVNVSKAFELFGLRGAQAAAILVRDFAGGAFQTALKSVFEVGTAANMAAIQSEGLAVKFKNLVDRAKLVALGFGDAGVSGALGFFLDVLKKATQAAEVFAQSAIGQIIIKAGLLAAAFAALRGATVFLVSALAGINIVKSIAANFAFLTTATMTSTGATIAMTGVIGKLRAAFVVLWAVMRAHPFAMVAGAIAAVIAIASQLSGSTEKLASEFSETALKANQLSKGLSLYADTIGLAKKGSDEYTSTLKRFAEAYPEVTKQIMSMKNVIDLADLSTQELVDSMREIAALKAWEALDKNKQAFVLYAKEIDNAKAAGRSLLADALGWGDSYTKLADNIAKAKDSQMAYTEALKQLVAIGAITLEQAYERIDALGLEEQKTQDLKDAFTAHFNNIKLGSADAATGMRHAFDGIPAYFEELYRTLDAGRQADLAKAITTMQSELAAHQKRAKDIGISEWDLKDQLEAIRQEAFDKFVGTLTKEEEAKNKSLEKQEASLTKSLEKQEAEYQKFADQLKSIEEKLAEDKKKIHQQGMTDEQISRDVLIEAQNALAEAIKAVSEATTAKEVEEAIKRVEIARAMYSDILAKSLSASEELKKQKTSVTTHSIEETQKEAAAVASAYAAHMESLNRKTFTVEQEIQRQQDAETTHLAWLEAENNAAIQKEVAALVAKYGVESEQLKNYAQYYVNTYGAAEAEIKLGLDKGVLATQQANASKERSYAESTDNMVDATDSLIRAIELLVDGLQKKFAEPIKMDVNAEQPKKELAGVNKASDDLKTSVEAPKKLKVDTTDTNQKLDDVKVKDQALKDQVNTPAELAVETSNAAQAIEEMERLDDEFKRQAEEPKNYIIDAAGVKVFFDETTRELRRVKEEIVEGKQYNIDISWAEAELLRLETSSTKLEAAVKDPKTYNLDAEEAKVSLADLQTKSDQLKTDIEREKGYGIDATAAKLALEQLDAQIATIQAEIDKQKDFVVHFKGQGSAETGLSDKITEINGLLTTLVETKWEATLNILVTGMDLLNEAIAKLEYVTSQVWKSVHQITVVGLDGLRSAIAYHQSLNGLHTYSTHTIRVEGEGSTSKPISEKIAEVAGLLDGLKKKAEKTGSKILFDFMGRGSSEEPISEKIGSIESDLNDLSDTASEGSTYTIDFEGSTDSGSGGIAEKTQEVKDLIGSLPASWQSYFDSLSGQYKLDFYEYAGTTKNKADDLAEFMAASGSSQREINSTLKSLYDEDLANYKGSVAEKAALTQKLIDSLPESYGTALSTLDGMYVGDFLSFAKSTQSKVDVNADAMADIGRSEADITSTKKDMYQDALDSYMEGLDRQVSATDDATGKIEGAVADSAGAMKSANMDASGTVQSTWVSALEKIIAKIDELLAKIAELGSIGNSSISIVTSYSLMGKQVTGYDNTTGKQIWTRFEPYRKGGQVKRLASGGSMDYPSNGGQLQGYGGGDTVPAMLEKGEFVIRKEAVSKYGSGLFSALNGMVQKFASGGSVRGGYAAVSAEEMVNLRIPAWISDKLFTSDSVSSILASLSQNATRKAYAFVKDVMGGAKLVSNATTMAGYIDDAIAAFDHMSNKLKARTIGHALGGKYEAAIYRIETLMDADWRNATNMAKIKQKHPEWFGNFGSGGNLAGYGGGDTVPAMLEKGEFVIRKEAVQKYGTGVFKGLNSMVAKFSGGGAVRSIPRPTIQAPQRFSDGGLVRQISNQLHTINLNINNKSHTLYGDEQSVRGLVKTLRREQLVTA